MGKFIDLTGQKFGRLLVLERAENKYGRTAWKCKCDCGNYKEVTSHDLKLQKIKSCNCLWRENLKSFAENNKGKEKHLKSRTSIYSTWRDMKLRCYNPKNISYKNYGKKEIKVCDEWLDKENGFLNFYNWAINNGYDENKTRKEQSLDRIDVNGNYEPNNCRWVTMKVQQNNRKNNKIIFYKNNKYTLSELSEKLKINKNTLLGRISRNWAEKDLDLPPNKNNKYRRNK